MGPFKINCFIWLLLAIIAASNNIKGFSEDDWPGDDDDGGEGWGDVPVNPGNGAPPPPLPPSNGPVDCSVTGKFYPHESECSKYYWCYGGRANVHQCPPGTVWDPSYNGCNFPGMARRTNCR